MDVLGRVHDEEAFKNFDWSTFDYTHSLNNLKTFLQWKKEAYELKRARSSKAVTYYKSMATFLLFSFSANRHVRVEGCEAALSSRRLCGSEADLRSPAELLRLQAIIDHRKSPAVEAAVLAGSPYATRQSRRSQAATVPPNRPTNPVDPPESGNPRRASFTHKPDPSRPSPHARRAFITSRAARPREPRLLPKPSRRLFQAEPIPACPAEPSSPFEPPNFWSFPQVSVEHLGPIDLERWISSARTQALQPRPRDIEDQIFVPTGVHVARVRERARDWVEAEVGARASWRATRSDRVEP
ncbi:Ulp1-like peptidase [Cucumis melo var. makuwa]|uniref:Ulp1-like peptidase n=1 Tax=Cucumis melo var. makuwa TaxID=1194695 RepID=A0A5A7TQ52_CUCMM|nr:Ulp1-like peptidase [Cucumis melo var. makuwa]